MNVKSESEVAQSCLTLRDPMDCSPPGSSIHGIFQARVLEWVAKAFSAYFSVDTIIYKAKSEIQNVMKTDILLITRLMAKSSLALT